MKCLSVWEPWASLLACGHKAYETRSWLPPYEAMRVDVAIHAGQSLAGMVHLDQDQCLADVCDRKLGRAHPFEFGRIIAVGRFGFTIPTDGIVAAGVLAEELAMGDWSPGRWAWRFLDVQHLRRSVPCRGRQKLFTLPADVAAQVQAQL